MTQTDVIAIRSTWDRDRQCDAVILGVSRRAEGGLVAASERVPAEWFDEQLLPALEALGFTGDVGEIVRIPSTGIRGARLIVAAGLGADPGAGTPDPEDLRESTEAAVWAVREARTVTLLFPAEDPATLTVVAETALITRSTFVLQPGIPVVDAIDELLDEPRTFTVVADWRDPSRAEAVLRRCETVASAIEVCRRLSNASPGALWPETFASAAERLAQNRNVRVTILVRAELEGQGFGGIVGVGKGSVHPPVLVRVEYRPSRSVGAPLAFVGKGVTFDSGGLSLKTPPERMVLMKFDMAGAAAVLGAMVAIADLELPVGVVAWLPMVENLPSGSALMPSEVIRMYGGTTVEVLNTDAEGRLIMADCIARACADGADIVVDVATLTGATSTALGERTASIMSNDVEFRASLTALATGAGDTAWPLPITRECDSLLASTSADLANVGGAFGGAIVAGAFLRRFVSGGTRWGHIDLGRSAFRGGRYAKGASGSTGAGLRTLVALAEHYPTLASEPRR